MAIDISGGGWRWRVSVFDSSDGQMWALAFDGGDGWQLWQRLTIDAVFIGGGGGGVPWRQQCSTVFDGQQPASTMREQEGGATRG